MKSMTGFGRGAGGEGSRRYEATVQGWNHRHADLVFRLPEALRGDESTFRGLALERVARGRCEIVVRPVGNERATPRRRLDREAFESFLREIEPLREAGLVEARWGAGELALSPFYAAAEAGAEETEDVGAARAAVREALAAFDAARADEGARLEGVLGEALAALAVLVDRLRERRTTTVAEIEAAVRARLERILPGGAEALPAERLAQEVVLLADRSDVSEELDRLDGHLVAVREAMAGPGPHGRRLDFLVQEVLRELNTIGSKSRDAITAQLVVEAKVQNEKVREQIQNVE